MFWYSLLAALGLLVVLTASMPVPGRIWALAIYSVKYGLLWLTDVVGLRKLYLAATGGGATDRGPTRHMLLRMWCEDMGPTFIKFGQIVASSAGMFPDAYVKEFQKVLDRVKPFPFDEVKLTLDQELGTEKAAQLVDIVPKQIASASIAQVHAAKLRDRGR